MNPDFCSFFTSKTTNFSLCTFLTLQYFRYFLSSHLKMMVVPQLTVEEMALVTQALNVLIKVELQKETALQGK